MHSPQSPVAPYTTRNFLYTQYQASKTNTGESDDIDDSSVMSDTMFVKEVAVH